MLGSTQSSMTAITEINYLIPDYYSKFTCIADRCPITCCQEWKIGVDADTNRKWKKLPAPETVPEQKKNLSAYTIKKDGQRVIGLDNDHRCPFLNSEKLCHLVVAYGDKVLSETCTTFPREEHRFPTHTEKMLMPCCPAVIDLWNKQKSLHFPNVSDALSDTDATGTSALFLLREKLLILLDDSSRTIEEELLESFYILQELYQHQPLTKELLEDYFSDSTVKELGNAIAEVELPPLDLINECNELLQDLSVNYQKEGLYQDTLNPILALAEEISVSLSGDDEAIDDTKLYDSDLLKQWERFTEHFKPYEPLLRNFLRNEVFSDLLLPDSDLENVLVQMQWIALEYAAIRHSIFLRWLLDGADTELSKISYETLRQYLVIITRMTGYETADIYEYLENSFESLLWDWGYFALIIGK